MVAPSSCKYAIFDAHLHGVNFIQQTDGFHIFGHFETLAEGIARYSPFLDCLSEKTRARVCMLTAEKLYASTAAI